MTTGTWDANQPEIHHILASLTRIVGLRATSREHTERIVSAVLLASGDAVLRCPTAIYSLLAQVMRQLPTHTSDPQTSSPNLAALRRLPADAQLLLTLAYWENLSAQELGRVFDCSAAEASRRLGHARTMLRRTEQRLADPTRSAATIPDSRHGSENPIYR